MKYAFILQHQSLLPNGEDSVCFIGVYSSVKNAEAAVERLALQPGFTKHPNIIDFSVENDTQGFCIDRYELDKDHWTEGFVTMVGGDEYSE